MPPRFANPHLLVQETEIVSRAAIEAEHDIPGGELEDESTSSLAILEQLLKRSFGDLVVGGDAVPADAQRKTKKRKLKDSGDGLAEPEILSHGESVAFRLVGHSTTVLSLKPKPLPKIVPYEPSYEDDDKEALVRAQRAAAAAVEASDIIRESNTQSYPTAFTKGKVICLPANSSISGPMVVIAKQKSQSGSSSVIPSFLLRLPEKIHPCPHDIPPGRQLSCPIVEQEVTNTAEKKKRRRRKHAERELHPPSFFRPQQEWGGKSTGYALGYSGSRPIPMGSKRQWTYRRDRAKEGIISRW